MSFTGIHTPKKHRVVAGVGAACLFGGLAVATVAAPMASAQPAGCTASELTGTVSSVTGAARNYLASHPGADQAVTAAMSQPRPEAEATLRGYFTANPGEYLDLRGILSPLGDAQRNCNLTVLPPDLMSAYNSFMVG